MLSPKQRLYDWGSDIFQTLQKKKIRDMNVEIDPDPFIQPSFQFIFHGSSCYLKPGV